MRPRSTETRQRYIVAGLELLSSGEDLTLQRLGDHLGLTHTAIYRHFKDLDELVMAVVELALADFLAAPPSAALGPREELTELLLRMRAGFEANPRIARAVSSSSGASKNLASISASAVAMLRRLGLEGDDLTACYQAVEGLALGVTAFDLARAPEHLAIRRERFRSYADPAFDAISRDDDDIAEHNRRAYRIQIDALLDACERLAVGAGSEVPPPGA